MVTLLGFVTRSHGSVAVKALVMLWRYCAEEVAEPFLINIKECSG
jgi:hypothetical protein